MSDLYPDGEDDGGHAIPLQTALNGKSGFVVEQLMKEVDVLKDQLSCEEGRLWEFFGNGFAQEDSTLNNIRSDIEPIISPDPESPGKIDIFLQEATVESFKPPSFGPLKEPESANRWRRK